MALLINTSITTAPLAIFVSPVNTPTRNLNDQSIPKNNFQVPDWVPWEDESEIERRQYPERFTSRLLPPDLQTLPPNDFRLVIDSQAQRKFLRFSNHIWNHGPGVLEFWGAFNPEKETVRVAQNIYREDGSFLQYSSGEFHFHPIHGHWHWEGFSSYEVWSLATNGNLDGLLASSDKVGYCLRDIAPYDDSQPSTPGYSSCYWARQGLSVGWLDTYRENISGQVVEISHLPEGVYALRSTVDPQNIIREVDDSNNSAIVYFALHADRIQVLGDLLTSPTPKPKLK
jgi:hypothetical protein